MELFQRGGLWWCDFRVEGRRYRKPTKQRTKTAAKTVADQLYRLVMQGTDPAPARNATPTLTAFAETFRDYIAKTDLDGDTKRYYENGARLLLATAVAGKRINLISSSDCDVLRFPGSGSNANCALRTLRRLLSYAADQRIIAASPRIHLRRENERKAVICSELEQDILRFAEQPFRDAFLVMQDSGMRPDEVIRLCWDDVLWDQSMIFVRHGKTQKATRHVPLSQRVREALRVRAQGCTSPWVFPSVRRRRNGERSHIRAFGLSKEWTRLRKLLAIPKEIVLYSARHTFGTDLMGRVNGNIVLVGDVMGHTDIKVTRRYIHPSTEGLSEVIDQRNRERKERHKSGHNALM